MTSSEKPLVSRSLCWGVGKRIFRKASLPGMRKGNFSASFRQKGDLPAPGNPFTTIRGGFIWGRGELSRLRFEVSVFSSRLPVIQSDSRHKVA